MLFALITFLVVLAILLGGYWGFVVQTEDRTHRDLKRKLKVNKTPTTAPGGALFVAEQPFSGVAGLNRVLRGSMSLSTTINTMIERAGVNMTVGTVVLSAVFIGVVAFSLTYWLSDLAAAAAAFGALSMTTPFLYLRFKAAKRVRLFEEQFPEALDLIGRALRAGHAFTTGLMMVADEIPDPVGGEFRLIHDRQNYGMPIGDALRDFGRRVPLLDARFFVTAVMTQRESGGNLAEVLDNLAVLIRERFKVKRQIRTLSAHGRITGWVLSFLAPTLAAILVVIAPAHMALMVTDPMGIQMIIGVMVLQIIGVLAIRKIINIEV
jgi:tight adherence protein B